jgi:hypothetical protein
MYFDLLFNIFFIIALLICFGLIHPTPAGADACSAFIFVALAFGSIFGFVAALLGSPASRFVQNKLNKIKQKTLGSKK